MKAGKVPIYCTGVPPPPVEVARRGWPFSLTSPLARTSRNFSPMMPKASSQEIGTKPGSSSRPLFGLVRFIGCLIRLGL